MLTTEAPIARLKPTGTGDEFRIAYWSHRRKWEDIDDIGRCVLPLVQALSNIANNRFFWIWTQQKTYKVELRPHDAPTARN